LGRPFVPIDLEQLKALMRFKPRVEDCAAFFKCSPDTIERRIRDEFDLSYAEFRDENMVQTRFALVQQALNKAMKGDNTMLIFCLKNFCGWSDKQPDDPADVQVNIQNNNLVANVDKPALEERIRQLKERK
jgi:hypothetical protein